MHDEELYAGCAPESDSDDTELRVDALTFGRREVIGGAIGVLAGVSSAAAADRTADIRLIRNPARNDEIGVAIDLTLETQERIGIALYPRTFGAESAPQAQTRTEDGTFRKAVEKLARFSFSDASFSNRGKYTLEFTCDAKSWTISARFFRRGDGSALPTSNTVDLEGFVRGKADAALVFALTRAQAEMLRWDLFGERLEVRNGGATLELSLGLPTQRTGVADWLEPELRLKLSPQPGSEIWALDGMALVPSLDIRQSDGDQGEGAWIQEGQELGSLAPNVGRPYRSRAWLGEALLPWTKPETGQQRLNRYEIGDVRLPRTKVAIQIVRPNRRSDRPARLVLRQWGSPRNTLAMMRAPIDVYVLGPGKTADDAPPDALFPLADALLTRQDVKRRDPKAPEKIGDNDDQIIEDTLAGHVDSKPFAVETSYGSFIVEGDEVPNGDKAKEAGPRADDEVPKNPLGRRLDRRTDFALEPAKGLTQFHLRAVRDAIKAFDVRARLRQVTIALPNSTKNTDNLDEPGSIWSRLDFDGTEIAFRLSLPEVEQTWPSARGIVTLGETPAQLYALAKAKKSEEPGKVLPPQVSIALDGARLRVRRDSDNLALTFGFVRMVLELGKNAGRIVPNVRLSGSGAGESRSSETGERKFDDRSLLIVNFPPQHVAEKAYFRQVNDGVTLPDVPSSLSNDKEIVDRYLEDLKKWRKKDASAPTVRRDRFKIESDTIAAILNDKKHDQYPQELYDQIEKSRIQELVSLCSDDGSAGKWLKALGGTQDQLKKRWDALPEDQRAFYLGPSSRAIDPDVRKVWLDIWRAYLALPVAQPDYGNEFAASLASLPDVELPPDVESDLQQRATNASGKLDKDKLTAAVVIEKRRRSYDFEKIYGFYADNSRTPPRPALLPKFYSGTAAIRDVWDKIEKDPQRGPDRLAILKFVQDLEGEIAKYTLEEFLPVTPARMSGPSRLVFRFDSAGGSFDDRKVGDRSNQGEALERVRAIDFSLEALTDWGRFDLAVTRRAETLELFSGGRLPHPDLRGFDLDPAKILAHQGIRAGRTVEGRMADIRGSLYAPRENETSIELPFRLYLSPDQFGRFRTRRPIARTVLRPFQDGALPTRAELFPVLWSANLEIGAVAPVVRAVWSDDFRPSAITEGVQAPEHGLFAPWSNGGTGPAATFRTALDAADRHEIVGLSSVYGLPVMGRRNELDSLIDTSQFEPPADYKLDGLKFDKSASGADTDLSGIYNPARLNISELRLTAVGGSLRHDTSFTPPASAVLRKDDRNLFDAFTIERWRQVTVLGRDIEVEVVYKGFLFPLGVRAVLVKLSERRFLRHGGPDGPVTAYLIQRKFIRIGKPRKEFPAVGQPNRSRRFPVSELMMLTRETPDIVDPDIKGSPASLPLSDAKVSLHPNGKLEFTSARSYPGSCFWPRTRPGERGNIAFEFKIDGDAVPLRMPLIFVDNRAANDPSVMATLTEYYNWSAGGTLEKLNKPLRTVQMGGVQRRYADENQDGECHFETFSWEIKAEGRAALVAGSTPPKFTNGYFRFDPLLQGSDQPPFYPYVDVANIRVGQAERFVGRVLEPWDVSFVDDYRDDGFPAAADAKDANNPANRDRYYTRYLERYLELKKKGVKEGLELNMGEAGDRSGGIGRPAMTVKYLSRRFGLMPKDAPVPKADTSQQVQALVPTPGDPPVELPAPPFDLKSFFSDDAKLLGILKFSDLLNFAGCAVPQLKEKVDAATEDTASFLRQSVLPEIERALKSLEEMWLAAQKALTSQGVSTRGIASLDIGQIYPDIKPALDELLDKVARAKSASNVELVDAMTQVQGAGRKLVTAISRTLSDPAAPLREELRTKFRIIREGLQAFVDDLSRIANKLIDDLRTALLEQVKNDIATYFRQNLDQLKPFARLFLSLPLPAIKLTPSLEVANVLDNALAEGTLAAILELANRQSLSDDAMQVAMTAGLMKAKAVLDSANLPVQAQATIDAYKDEAGKLLQGLADQSNAIKNAARERLLRQVPGVLQPLLFGERGVLSAIAAEADELKGDLTRGGNDALDRAARHIGTALRRTVSVLIEGKVQALCNNLIGKITRVADETLVPLQPGPDHTKTLESVRKAIEDLGKAFQVKVDDRLAEALDRFNALRELLSANTLADLCSVKDPKDALSGVAARALRELTALRFSIGTLLAEMLAKLETAAAAAKDKEVQAIVDQAGEFVGASAKALVVALDSLDKAIPPPPDGKTALGREIGIQIDQLHSNIGSLRTAFVTVQAMFEYARTVPATPNNVGDAVNMLIVVLRGVQASTDTALQQSRDRLVSAFEKKTAEEIAIIQAGALKAMRAADDQIAYLLGQTLLAGDAAKRAAIMAVGHTASPVFQALLDNIYGPADALRVKGRDAFKGQGLLQKILSVLKGPEGQPLSDLFTVRSADGSGADQLDQDKALLQRLVAVNEATYVEDVAALANSWFDGTASPVLLLRNIDYVIRAVLRGDFAQFVDLQQIRRQLDQTLRSMVPARISRSYDLKLHLDDMGELITFSNKSEAAKKFGLPKAHPKGLPETLVLEARGTVDVLQPKNSTFDAVGYLPGFALQLLPGFDVATFSFPPTSFSGGLGKPFDLSLKVQDVVLGKQVEFLKQLQSILGAPKDGAGFYLRPMVGRGGIGIVSGYALPISPITIGNMYIDNLSLNIAAELPFDGGDARFVASVSRPEAPFMIAVAPYAGAGHLGLIANPKGIVGFEASFQFGGGGGFAFGPLTGRGRISVGIFVRKIAGFTELYGLFYAGGSARIACFGCGASLNVRMSQAGGNVEGEAIFTFSFSIGIKDIEFSVTVFKREQGSGGGNSGQGGTGRRRRRRQAPPLKPAAGTYAVLANNTRCKGENFRIYRTYFSQRDVLAPGRAVGGSPNRKVWTMP